MNIYFNDDDDDPVEWPSVCASTTLLFFYYYILLCKNHRHDGSLKKASKQKRQARNDAKTHELRVNSSSQLVQRRKGLLRVVVKLRFAAATRNQAGSATTLT